MQNNIPGVIVPEELIARLKVHRIRKRGDSHRRGVHSAAAEIKGVAGVHIMDLGWKEAVPEIVERGSLPASGGRLSLRWRVISEQTICERS